MSQSHLPPPSVLARACTAVEWPTDAIASLLADPAGHDLAFESAYDIAWSFRDSRTSATARRDALALLQEFGLPETPDPMAAVAAEAALTVIDPRS